MAQPNATQRLASFVANATLDDLSPRTQTRTKIILLDALASALAGRSADESPIVIGTGLALLGKGTATLLSGGTGSQGAAAMINGYLITAVTVCDIHVPTVCHVTPEVVPPALAVAEERGSSGAGLLLAIALGLEVTTRVGIGTNYASFRQRGFHSPGVTGPLGGATAAGRLLGLDGAGLTHAFGIAASQAAGTWAQLGTPTIKYQQARGSLGGLLSAQLAARGFTATIDGLGAADGGLFSSYSDGGDPEAMLSGIGETWELENISLRAWPAAAYLQGVVTAVLGLLGQHDVAPGEVERLIVQISPSSYALHGEREPRDRFEARLTARYVAAVVFHDRACWMEQFTAERFSDPVLAAWSRDRVEVVSDASVSEAGASIEAHLTGGETVRFVADVPKGDPADALSFGDVSAKMRHAGANLGLDDAIEQLISTVANLEAETGIGPALAALRSSPHAAPDGGTAQGA